MPKHMAEHYRRKHLKDSSKNPQSDRERDFRYPLEKPIVDIYREINEDLWRENFEDFFHSTAE